MHLKSNWGLAVLFQEIHLWNPDFLFFLQDDKSQSSWPYHCWGKEQWTQTNAIHWDEYQTKFNGSPYACQPYL